MESTSLPPIELEANGFIPVKRLFRYHDTLMVRAQLYISIVAAVVCLLGLAYWRIGEVDILYRQLAVLVALLMFIIYKLFGVFRQSRGRLLGTIQLAKAWSVTVLLVLTLGFITRTTDEFSRLVIGGWVALGFLVQMAGYLVSFRLCQRFHMHFCDPVPTLVVGSHWLAKHLVESLNKNTWLPDEVVGVVDNSYKGRDNWDNALAPWLGSTHDIVDIVKQKNIRRIYIALPLSCSDMIETIYKKLVDHNVDIIWAPDIFALKLLNHGVREVAGVPLLTLSESPLTREGQAFVKSAMDHSIALMMLIVLSPLMLATAIAIKLTSPGPIIYKQKRHGWDGRIIEVWKFRSMYVHKEGENTVTQATKTDPRITKVGRFIRRTSIDELPQLFNVLSGSMSLVGPRPHAIQHDEFYTQHIKSYMIRLRIKPGLTGLAQVNGCRGETEFVEKMEKRVEYDIDYINRWSIWLDLKVLIKTPFTLLRKDIY
ncbi:undecaprenyl-phosphate glucose phosphotransferase [Pseudomaricurvus alcaniphilus]|uniref:undecaprenyl-phosphate glucose phosphotransferase n=1 Tax=Pseudomaricurvus alcaniphilus TaxID=1166482 RepID=UPI001A9E4F51|nr:undecaprenyl-phosphate glucose phosphotransferase [Pseudomaricurvus alcaniphilus]